MEHKILEERPDPKDYDLQPYGYIVALTAYIDNLEAEIKTLPEATSDNMLIYMEKINELVAEVNNLKRINSGLTDAFKNRKL